MGKLAWYWFGLTEKKGIRQKKHETLLTCFTTKGKELMEKAANMPTRWRSSQMMQRTKVTKERGEL